MKSIIYKWFDSYTSAYRKGADAQTHEIKYQHSIYVAQNCSQIARQEKFSENDTDLAEIIGILHDCGRFEQFKQYRTYNDKISKDHAAMSVKIIEQHSILNEFSSFEQDIILKSILLHNKREINRENLSALELPFIKLIRDADKADIFRVMKEQLMNPKINKKTLLLNQSEEIAYSTPIIDSIRKKELANLQDIKTMVDFRLIQLSWVFDVNYKSTLDLFKKQGYLLWLIDSLPGKELITDELVIIKNQLLSA